MLIIDVKDAESIDRAKFKEVQKKFGTSQNTQRTAKTQAFYKAFSRAQDEILKAISKQDYMTKNAL